MSPKMFRVDTVTYGILTVVLVMVVPRPGNPHVNVAFAFVDEMFPVTWSVDKITLPPIELGWG